MADKSLLMSSRELPTSDEVSAAAHSPERTLEIVQKYKLSAVDVAQLLDRLAVKPVPW